MCVVCVYVCVYMYVYMYVCTSYVCFYDATLWIPIGQAAGEVSAGEPEGSDEDIGKKGRDRDRNRDRDDHQRRGRDRSRSDSRGRGGDRGR